MAPRHLSALGAPSLLGWLARAGGARGSRFGGPLPLDAVERRTARLFIYAVGPRLLLIEILYVIVCVVNNVLLALRFTIGVSRSATTESITAHVLFRH